uniref:LuxR C-terminal-related transcriptional regulator n=1 Tax=Nocardia vinacea TaxID=96468 RepID=UPI0012F650BA
MTLTLPSYLPAPVIDCVAGHFPRGDETATRRAADYWSDKAEQCRGYAEHHHALAARTENDLRGETGTAIARNHRDLAEKFDAQADFMDTLVKELYEAANTIEEQKWTVIGFALLLAWQMARAALMFSPVGGAFEAYIDRLETETKCQIATRRLLIFLAGQSSKYATQRGAIVLAGKAMFWGALQVGGINVAVQAGQVMAGDREHIDWKSARNAAAAGGVGGAAGALAGKWIGERWIVPRTAARAEQATGAQRLAYQLVGTSLVGATGGLAGGILGALTSILVSGQQFTTKAITEGLLPAVTGGFLGAAAHGAAEIRNSTPTSASEPPVTAPAEPATAAPAEPTPRTQTRALANALTDHGVLNPTDPAGLNQQISQILARLRQPAAEPNQLPAPAPFLREDYHAGGIWKPKSPDAVPAEGVNTATADQIQHPTGARLPTNVAAPIQAVYPASSGGGSPVSSAAPQAVAPAADGPTADGSTHQRAEGDAGNARPHPDGPAPEAQRPTPHPVDSEPARPHTNEPTRPVRDSGPTPEQSRPRVPQPATTDNGHGSVPAPGHVGASSEGAQASSVAPLADAGAAPQVETPAPRATAEQAAADPQPHPADSEATARPHSDEPTAQPDAQQQGSASDDAGASGAEHSADTENGGPQARPTDTEADGDARPHPADTDTGDGARPHPADAGADGGVRAHPSDADPNGELPQPVPAASGATPNGPARAGAAQPPLADGRAAGTRADTPAGSPQRGQDRRGGAAADTPRQVRRRMVVTAQADTKPPELEVTPANASETTPVLVSVAAPVEAGVVVDRPADPASSTPGSPDQPHPFDSHTTPAADPTNLTTTSDAPGGGEGSARGKNASADGNGTDTTETTPEHTGAPEPQPDQQTIDAPASKQPSAAPDTAEDHAPATARHPADSDPAGGHADEPTAQPSTQHGPTSDDASASGRPHPADAEATDGPRPHPTEEATTQPAPENTPAKTTDEVRQPTDNDPANAGSHTDEPTAQPSTQHDPTPDDAPASGQPHAEATDGPRPHPAEEATTQRAPENTPAKTTDEVRQPTDNDPANAGDHTDEPTAQATAQHGPAPDSAPASGRPHPAEEATTHPANEPKAHPDSADPPEGASAAKSSKTVDEPGEPDAVDGASEPNAVKGATPDDDAAAQEPRSADVAAKSGDEQASTGNEEPGATGRGAAEREAEAQQRIAQERQRHEALREDQQRRVDAAAERERAAREVLREKENKARAAAAHERATRRGIADKLGELLTGSSPADRVAIEAERAAHAQAEVARAELAEARAAHDAAVAEHEAVSAAVARELAISELRVELAELPRADPQTKQDLTEAQGEQYTATAKKALKVYRARQEELAGESWEQRRQVMESGDEVESLLRCFDAMREGTGKTPRWNQIKSFLVGERGFMRQMGTGQGKSLVGALDGLWQLSRGEPVQLADGRSVRVHHVITTTEVLANEGVREFGPMLRSLGYEVSRWDTHNPPADPQQSTLYYLTYDERATAELFGRPPAGDSATIDEADAVLVHEETVHYLSEGQRAPATDTEAAGVYRVRDFLRGVLADRELTSADLRARPQESLAKASRLWEQRTGRAFTTEETEMARAFLDVKAGRLKLNRDFQKFDGKIQILDANGKPRSDPKVGTDSRWFGGRHKMVEAMFDVPVYSDGSGSKQVTVETVLGGYKRLNLMSGTLERTATEIKDNFPVQGGLAKIENFGKSNLVAEEDRIFLTGPEMFKDAVERVRELQDEGRPVLVIAANDVAWKFSLMLNKNGIEHTGITGKWFAEHRDNNAAEEHLTGVMATAGKQHTADEPGTAAKHDTTRGQASDAGGERKKGNVTVGTPGMLGRGFDAVVDDNVNQLGGLHAHMLGRSDNPDTNDQCAARAGRNGRHGSHGTSDTVNGSLYSQTQSPRAKVAVMHFRNAAAEHAQAVKEHVEATREANTPNPTQTANPDSAAPAAAKAKPDATAADVTTAEQKLTTAEEKLTAAEKKLTAAEQKLRDLTPALENEAAERARLERAIRRANQAHTPTTTGAHLPNAPPTPHTTPTPQPANQPPINQVLPTSSDHLLSPATPGQQDMLADKIGKSGREMVDDPATVLRQAQDGHPSATQELQQRFGDATLEYVLTMLGWDPAHGTAPEPVQQLAHAINTAGYHTAQLNRWQIPAGQQPGEYLAAQLQNVLLDGLGRAADTEVEHFTNALGALRGGHDLSPVQLAAINGVTKAVRAQAQTVVVGAPDTAAQAVTAQHQGGDTAPLHQPTEEPLTGDPQSTPPISAVAASDETSPEPGPTPADSSGAPDAPPPATPATAEPQAAALFKQRLVAAYTKLEGVTASDPVAVAMANTPVTAFLRHFSTLWPAQQAALSLRFQHERSDGQAATAMNRSVTRPRPLRAAAVRTITAGALRYLARSVAAEQGVPGIGPDLTGDEVAVLHGTAQGLLPFEIAAHDPRGWSRRKAVTAKTRAAHKLGAANGPAAVALAVRRGDLDITDFPVAEQHGAVALTGTEVEILTLVAKGFADEAISDVLPLTESQVKLSLDVLGTRFGIDDRAGMVAVALREGLLDLDGPTWTNSAEVRTDEPTLSRREREVLALVASGQTVAGIAALLGLADNTVKTYIGRIRRKLDVSAQDDPVAAAFDRGIELPGVSRENYSGTTNIGGTVTAVHPGGRPSSPLPSTVPNRALIAELRKRYGHDTLRQTLAALGWDPDDNAPGSDNSLTQLDAADRIFLDSAVAAMRSRQDLTGEQFDAITRIAQQLADRPHRSNAGLTDTELAVLAEFTAGKTPAEIASDTGRRYRDVQKDAKNIRAKLGATDITHAVQLGVRLGISSLSDISEPEHLAPRPLTPREAEILGMIFADKTTVAIAQQTGLARDVVQTTINRMLRKFGVGTRVEAVVHALRLGYIDLDNIPGPAISPHRQLSGSELEIVRLAAAGQTNEQIGNSGHLGLSPDSVGQILPQIFEMLGVRTRSGAVVQALRLGYLDLADIPTPAAMASGIAAGDANAAAHSVTPLPARPASDDSPQQQAASRSGTADAPPPAVVVDSDATAARQIKQAIAAELLKTYGIEVLGLDKSTISIETALSIRNAIVDEFAEDPALLIDAIVIAPMARGTHASTGTVLDGLDHIVFLNEIYFGNVDFFREGYDAGVRNGWLTAPTGDPVYDCLRHELFHLRDPSARRAFNRYNRRESWTAKHRVGRYSLESKAFGFLYAHFDGLKKARALPPEERFDDWLDQLDGYSRHFKTVLSEDYFYAAYNAWLKQFNDREAEFDEWLERFDVPRIDGKVQAEAVFEAWHNQLDEDTWQRILSGAEYEESRKTGDEPLLGDRAVFNPTEALAEANNAFGKSAPKDFTHPAYALQALLRGVPVAQVWRDAEKRNALAAQRASDRGPVPAPAGFQPSIKPSGRMVALATAWRQLSADDQAAESRRQPHMTHTDRTGWQYEALDELARLVD